MDPDPDEPMHEIVNAVLTTADPSLAEAMREFIASAKDPAPPVQAVITESAEAVYINERRDTTEAPPLVVPGEVDVTLPTPAPREIIDAKTSEVAPRTLQAALIADGRAAACKTEEVAPEPKPAEEPTAFAARPSHDAARPTVRAPAIVVAAAAGSAPVVTADARAHVDNDDRAHVDAVAKERGLAPLRMPSEGSAYMPVREARRSRTVLVAAMSLAAVCVVVTIGTILWARSAVADAHQPATDPPAGPAPSVAIVEPAPSVVLPVVPVAPETCSMTVRSTVAGATVWVDGTARGAAPVTLPAACRTTVAVEVRHPRYQDFKQTVPVEGEVEVDARLERDKTELTVWSQPEGAEVTYNGTVLGKTPLTTRINRYEQGTLYFRAPGHETDWRRIVPREPTKTVSIHLKPAS